MITITNLHSQTPPQFIDTGMKIITLALTGNILLVLGQKHPSPGPAELVAWRLTEEGVVNSTVADGRAGRGDSIWTVSVTDDSSLRFSVEDQIVLIDQNNNLIHVYHTGTGEVLEPTQTPPHLHGQYHLREMADGQHYPHYRELKARDTCSEDDWPITFTLSQEGWIKDPKGKHRLWTPVEWRTNSSSLGWFPDIAALRFNHPDGTVIITF